MSARRPSILFTNHSASRDGARILLLQQLQLLRANTDCRLEVLSDGSGPLIDDFRAVAPNHAWRNPPFCLRANKHPWANALTSSPITLALACDEGYAMPLATTLRSIVDSNPNCWPLDIHVLVADFPEATRRRVAESLPEQAATINWISVDLGIFRGFSTAPGVSMMTYARFLIPHVIPERVSKILYLDTDILVLGDLSPLWSQDLGGAVVGAVLDGLDEQVKANSERVAGVPKVKQYFNAGVLLVDLTRWRAERVSERALEYLRCFPDSPFSDQDALNVVCDGLWKRVDTRWNFQAHLRLRIADMAPEDLPTIVHFITNLKPWKARSVSLNSSLYESFRSRTRFARTSSEKISDFFVANAMCFHNLLSRSSLWRLIWRHAKGWARRGDVAPPPGSSPTPLMRGMAPSTGGSEPVSPNGRSRKRRRQPLNRYRSQPPVQSNSGAQDK